MIWQGRNIVDLSNDELATLSSHLTAMDAQNQTARNEAAKNPRYKKNNKDRSSLGERNPIFDQLVIAVNSEMTVRGFERPVLEPVENPPITVDASVKELPLEQPVIQDAQSAFSEALKQFSSVMTDLIVAAKTPVADAKPEEVKKDVPEEKVEPPVEAVEVKPEQPDPKKDEELEIKNDPWANPNQTQE